MGSEKDISIKDIMTTSVMSVDVSATVTDVAKLMEDAKIGAVVVMENNAPVGIVTDRDIAIKVVAHSYHFTTPVKTIMSTPLISMNPDETVRMAADLMYARQIRKLPIIDNDKVIGIVTGTDLVTKFAISTEEDIRNMYSHSITKIYQNSPYS